MKDFRQHFLSESAEKLQNIIADLEIRENLSEAEKRALFHTLHTIKGTSQTFGLNDSSRLAHKLENLLCAETSENSRLEMLLEGIEHLRRSFEQKDFEFPEKFSEKIQKIAPDGTGKTPNFEFILRKIPPEIIAGLSSLEKRALYEQLKKGKNLFCAGIVFEISEFNAGLKNFREILNKSGEIIAAFPGAGEAKKIGFQILFASFADKEKIREITRNFSPEITSYALPEVFTFDLQGILAQTIAHGKNVAEALGKTVEFEIPAENCEISEKHLKLIFDSLLHLTRNAVDHAFETQGKIKIELSERENGLLLTFSDDGRGLDRDKIRARAVEKNLIKPEENLADEATLCLIFQSEFSTAREVTEISGRGIGLDAVKNAVETAGGKIRVKSEKTKGATFEIFLPKDV